MTHPRHTTGAPIMADLPFYDNLLIVRSGIAGGALLSCILVFILAAAFSHRDEDARKLPTLRLVLYITLVSSLRSIIILIQVAPAIDNSLYCNGTWNDTCNDATGHCSNYCVITGYLYRTVSMMGVLFTLTATVHMLLITFAVKYSWKLEVGYVLVPLILPLTYTWVSILVYYETDKKELLQDWCNYTSTNNDVLYIDMPRLIVELINILLVIVTVFCGMPKRYIQIRKDGEEVGVWMKQVLPILIHSVFYLGMNWFSLSDHLNRIHECNGTPNHAGKSHAEHLQLAHAITSAGRGLLVGITFTAYLLIMLYIRWKHQNITVDGYGTFSASSSLDSESLISTRLNINKNDMYLSTSKHFV